MRISALFAVVLLAVALLYMAGYTYDLFWRWWWFDIVLHTLGGIGIGLMVVRIAQVTEMQATFLVAGIVALAIGCSWEVFEYYAGLPQSIFMSYAVDTTKDMLMDITGSFIGVSIARAL